MGTHPLLKKLGKAGRREKRRLSFAEGDSVPVNGWYELGTLGPSTHPGLRWLEEGGALPSGFQKAAPVQVKPDCLCALILQLTLVQISDLD